MINVLNIISDTNIGGAGRVIRNYAKYADTKSFETSVVMPAGSELKSVLSQYPITIHEIDGIADKSLDTKAIGLLKELIKKLHPDIVHTHGSMSGRIAARRCGVKTIYTRHSVFPVKSYIKKGPGRLLNKLVNEHYADRIIAVSPAAAENLTDGGISPELIDIVMNGVDPVPRKSEQEIAALKDGLGISKDDFVVGILARIEDYKGHMDILDALKTLKDSGRRVKLLIAGAGAYEAEVKARAKELGLSENAVFMGFLSDVSGFLSILDVQLNASWGTEATSLSILEGFSMGLPAVMSDYGGNPYLIQNGENGFLFKTRSSAELSARIAEIMDDELLLPRLRQGAKRAYSERFTGEIFARNLEEVYRKTLKRESERGTA